MMLWLVEQLRGRDMSKAWFITGAGSGIGAGTLPEPLYGRDTASSRPAGMSRS